MNETGMKHTKELWERINMETHLNIATLLKNLFAGVIGSLERFLLMCVEERAGERGAREGWVD